MTTTRINELAKAAELVKRLKTEVGSWHSAGVREWQEGDIWIPDSTAIEAADLILSLSSRVEKAEAALKRIIEIDQEEKSTLIDFDPAGSTYEVTKVDGWCAKVARNAINQPGEKP